MCLIVASEDVARTDRPDASNVGRPQAVFKGPFVPFRPPIDRPQLRTGRLRSLRRMRRAPGLRGRSRRLSEPHAADVLWLIAQTLPASHSEGTVALWVTLLGWLSAIVVGMLSVSLWTGLWGLAGWTADSGCWGALVARRRGKLSPALGLSWVAFLCALAEVVFIYLSSGGTHCCDLNAPDANAYGVQIIEPTWDSVGLGTWVWVASFALVVASSWCARRRSDSRLRTGRSAAWRVGCAPGARGPLCTWSFTPAHPRSLRRRSCRWAAAAVRSLGPTDGRLTVWQG